VMNALSGAVHTAGVDLLRGPLGVEETALTPIGASYVFRGAAGVWDLGTLQVPGADLLLPQPNGHALAWAGDALFHIAGSTTEVLSSGASRREAVLDGAVYLERTWSGCPGGPCTVLWRRVIGFDASEVPIARGQLIG